jgi:hypothetical protein
MGGLNTLISGGCPDCYFPLPFCQPKFSVY